MKSELGNIILSVMMTGLLFTGCSGTRSDNMGVQNGKLLPCPPTPNCVSSQSTDKGHAIEPLRYSSSTPEAMAALKQIVQQMKRTTIVKETNDYLYVEFTSAMWRFVDDVEFWFDENTHTIHVRSASRKGKSDLGVNRKRIEEIRTTWDARIKSSWRYPNIIVLRRAQQERSM